MNLQAVLVNFGRNINHRPSFCPVYSSGSHRLQKLVKRVNHLPLTICPLLTSRKTKIFHFQKTLYFSPRIYEQNI